MQLPRVVIEGVTYFVDVRLKQLRNIDNPHDFLEFPDEAGLLDHCFNLGTPNPDSWKQSRFTLDALGVLGDKSYEAFHRDENWNGWSVPYFGFSEGLRLTDDLRAAGLGDADYSTTGNEFRIKPTDGSTEAYEAQVVYVPDEDMPYLKPVTVYPIGAFSWCWNESKVGE